MEKAEGESRTEGCQACEDASCAARERRPDEDEKEFADRQRLEARLCRIRYGVIMRLPRFSRAVSRECEVPGCLPPRALCAA